MISVRHTPAGIESSVPFLKLACTKLTALVSIALLGLTLTAAKATPWNHTSWPPPTANCDVTASVPMYASVTATPTPSITLNFIKSGMYQIFRKDPSATTWGTAVVTLGSDLNTWTDTNVVAGQMYEYKCVLTDPPASPSLIHVPNPKTYVAGTPADPTGYILSGINVDETQPRGHIIVLVASDVPVNLPAEYNQYLSDLQADGWFVHQISVPPIPTTIVGYDILGANALATVTVTNGGTGYLTTTSGTTNGTTDYMFTDTTTGSIAFGTLTLASGTSTISAVTITTGGAGGGFNVGDTLTIGDVASSTGSGATFKVGSVTSGAEPTPQSIRAQIQAIYNQYPGQVKDLVIVGKVPACRTGSTLIGDPDGHEVNDGATGADGYYANMTGTWTDTGSNAPYYPYDGVTLANPETGELNTPNDGKFDQYYMSDSGGEADLGFGRIDLSDGIAGQYEALKAYFDKLHRFKTCSPDFLPGRRIIFRGGDFENVDGTGWEMAYSVNPHNGAGAPSATNPANDIDAIANSDLPTEVSASFDADADYSGQHGPYLFYFKGSGGPGIGVGGEAVFWTGCQSHWGWWYSSTTSSGENSEALRLGESSFGLSWTWDIFGTRYFYHRMNLGMDAGDMMRVSVNNVDSTNGTYAFVTDPNTTDGGYIAPCTGALFMNHIGDPTLRFFMVAPPTNLSVVPGSQASLTWTASTDGAVIGYHIYRAPLSGGAITAPYTRLTSSPVAGATYTDTDPTAGTGTGQWSYMVKAIKLETTGSGSFYNASLGAMQSVDQTNPPATLTITSPATLPVANWNTAYSTALTATGGTPNYTWSYVSGQLPPGLSLTSNGAFTGLPTTGGAYTFTARVTDALGQTAQQAFTITTNSGNVITLLPEASAYTISTASTRVQGPTETMLVAPGNYSFLRFNIAGINFNNTLVSATLRLYTATGTPANSISLTEAGLTPDSEVNWSMATLDWANQPIPDNTAVPSAQGNAFPVPLNYVDIDVTQELAYAIANNTTGKFGVRLFTTSPNQTITFCSGYSYNNAIPVLTIQTSNAPRIAITSPASNSPSIYAGSGLAISATVTPVPANAASLTTQWTQVSGPGTASFSSTSTPNTTVIFPVAGAYVLQLAANDSVLQSAQTLTVNVLTVPVTGPTDSEAMRLPFDDGSGTAAHDATGNGNNGTLINGAAWGTGKIGGAVSLSGSNQQVDVADNANHPTDGQQSMSFSFWFNATGPLDTDGSFRGLMVKPGAYTFELRGSSVYTTVSNLQENPVTIVAGQWYHVAVVFNGAAQTQETYINGVPTLLLSTTATSVARKATSALLFGAVSTTDTHAFNGLIDEARVYTRALTLAEVQALAAAVPSDIGPVITTNTSLTGAVGSPLALNATVTDSGNPLTYNWSETSGPATLSFTNPTTLSASATPTQPGSYGLQLTANDGFITTAANIGAAITGLTFSSWASSNGLTGNNALQTAVLEPDGLNNLYKYALGLNPFQIYNPGSSGLPYVQTQVSGGSTYLTLTFDGTATDVTYTVQATSNLGGTWTTIESFPSGGTPPGAQTVFDTQPINSSNQRFMRLLMTNP